MQGKYFFIVFCVIFLLAAPAAAGLNKIAAGSPVFIGENDVDISSALNGCHTIAWWQNGTSRAASPAKNLNLYEMNSVSDTIYHYNISQALFNGYTGTWYCEDNLNPHPVFDLRDPQVTLRVWDLDHDLDVTGETIPRATNITYRIDTNLYSALSYTNRPNSNPSDSFFTIKLTDPLGRNIPNIYTGSYGVANTLILPFDTNPYVSSTPYLWKNGNTWDHTARNIQGDNVYPPSTYTFTLTQNLNHMQESFATGGVLGLDGKTASTATVTFPAPEPLVGPSSAVTVVSTLPGVTISSGSTPVPPKATVIRRRFLLQKRPPILPCRYG
ncbi:MAG: DUF3821 domain-containing protein [Methanoregula sp.]|jgi:hypothetical protein